VPSVVSSIVGEFRRYKALGDAALAQLKDEELDIGDPQHGTNSAAILVWQGSPHYLCRSRVPSGWHAV